MPDKNKSKLVMAREGKVGHISIVGPIGWSWFGLDYAGFKSKIEALGDVNIIEVEINSPGGIVTDGVAILNTLVNHPATVHTYVNGEAASIASVIAMAGDRIFIPDNSLMFLHKPLNGLIGNADDMRKMADDLDKFEKAIVNAYQRHFKGSDEAVQGLMTAETWLTAEEVAEQFDNVTVMDSKGMQAAAHSDPLAMLGDMQTDQGSESFAKKIVKHVVNTFKKRTDITQLTQEDDMPIKPEDRKQIVDDVVEALKKDGLTVAAVVEAPVVAVVAPVVTEAPVVVAAAVVTPVVDEIVFEGDKADPVAVAAHLKKVQMKQLQNSADLSTPAGVIAYQGALNKLLGTDDAPVVPSNVVPAQGATGAEAVEGFTEEQLQASATRMSKK